jgi:hypothetical protein
MERIVNLTPHPVTVIGGVADLPCVTYPSAGEARAEPRRQQVDSIHVADDEGPILVPIYRVSFGAIEGLPAPQLGTTYIVSRITAEVARDAGRPTDDLLIPDDLVRDDSGQPLGCRAFARL